MLPRRSTTILAARIAQTVLIIFIALSALKSWARSRLPLLTSTNTTSERNETTTRARLPSFLPSSFTFLPQPPENLSPAVFDPQHTAGDSVSEDLTPPSPRGATYLSPSALMARPLPLSRTTVPRLLHQSWKDNATIPPLMETWARSCREVNEGWEYVLWRDSDNKALVEKFARWFKETYESLGGAEEGKGEGRGEIYRADAARFIYMGVFGG